MSITDDISSIRAEEQAQAARDRARETLLMDAPAPDEAAGIVRDSEELGLPPFIVGRSPLARRSAQAARDVEALDSSPALQAWLADGGVEQMSAARDDFDILGQIERDVAGLVSSEMQRADEWMRAGKDIWRRGSEAVSTPERREELLQSVAVSAVRAQINLRDPEFWKRQGDNAERIARTTVRNVGDFFEGLPDAFADFNEQREVGQRSLELADLELAALQYGEASLTPEQRARRDELNAAPTPMPRTWLGPAGQSLPFMLSTIGEGAEQAAPGALQGAALGATIAGIGGQAGPQAALPEELVTVPAGAIAGLGLGARTGFAYGSTVRAGQLEAGLAYSEFRQMTDESGRPLDPEVARGAALIVGMVNGGLEIASLRSAIKAVPGGEALLRGMTRDRMRQLLTRPTVRDAILRGMGRLAYVGAVESATEFSQETMTILGGTLAQEMDGGTFYRPSFGEQFNRAAQAGWYGLQAGTVFGGAGASVGLAIDVPRARRAEQDARVIDQLAATSERSNLRRRLPERFHAFIDHVTRGGPLETIYVDAVQFREFFQTQGVDPAQVADTLEGVGRSHYEEAVAARDDIAIPAGTFATRIAGTPAYEGLREHMRFREDADTLAEARNKFENEENIRRTLGQIERETELRDDELEAQQVIVRDLRRQLDRVGVTVSDANAIQAEAIGRALVVLAGKGQENPISLYRRFFGNISGPNDAQQAAAAVNRAVSQSGALDVEGFARGVMERNGLADLRITRDASGDLVLEGIGIDKKGQRRGVGGRAMEEIAAFADQHGLRIRSTPPKRGGQFGTTSQARARGFLSRYGFVDNAGDRRDNTIAQSMFRPPTGQRRLDQAEAQTGTQRFDTQAVDPRQGELSAAIPDVGSIEFTLLLDSATEKLERGAPLSFLEAWAADTARGDNARRAATGSREYFAREGEQEPLRDGPLPPLPRENTASLVADPAVRQQLAALMAERDRLNEEIEARQQERDLPAVVEARKDARAMRAAAYCAARGMTQDAARVRAFGQAAAIVPAAAAVAAVVPGETTDGEPPAIASAPEGEPPRVVVQLPPVEAAEVVADLPAEAAEAAEMPEVLEEALAAHETETDPDLPITTNNRAAREGTQE